MTTNEEILNFDNKELKQYINTIITFFGYDEWLLKSEETIDFNVYDFVKRTNYVYKRNGYTLSFTIDSKVCGYFEVTFLTITKYVKYSNEYLLNLDESQLNLYAEHIDTVDNDLWDLESENEFIHFFHKHKYSPIGYDRFYSREGYTLNFTFLEHSEDLSDNEYTNCRIFKDTEIKQDIENIDYLKEINDKLDKIMKHLKL